MPELVVGLLSKCLLPDVILYANLPPEDFNLLKVKECPYPAPVSRVSGHAAESGVWQWDMI